MQIYCAFDHVIASLQGIQNESGIFRRILLHVFKCKEYTKNVHLGLSGNAIPIPISFRVTLVSALRRLKHAFYEKKTFYNNPLQMNPPVVVTAATPHN